ncbi:MAG: hypothetical protein FWC34_04255 [Bacteroidetes bacterium]|nr:hypothetical protein [Bacteroidota bacterium]MCL2303273.1 hypothetical protein [Lentimicrobiaceae bacterium]
MKSFFTFITVAFLCMQSFSQDNPFFKAEYVEAKDIIEQLEIYIGKTIETEGKIVHVCGVDKKKMKLFVEDVGSINIIPEDAETAFDYNFNQKEIRVVGVVKEIRISKERVGEMEENFDIPCSIDKEPCIDHVYKENKRNNGTLVESSKKGINAMKETMEKTQKDYISIATIVAKTVGLK